MKYIQRTVDAQLIKDILSTDNIYDGLVYDGSPDFNEFQPNVKDNIWFILKENNNTCGLITLEYLNYVLWVPHIVIFEKYRGKDSITWGKQAASYMRYKCGAKRFLAMTPYINAKRYAEKMGFNYIATLPKSIKKNGKLLDQYMLEMR